MADLEQQQTSVVPPTHDAYPPAGNGGDFYSPWAWIKTPRGILRMVEWLFSIVSFACMANVGDGWDTFSDFKFLVAVGVLAFLYTMVVMITYICRPSVDKCCTYQPPIELALDGILCVLLLAAGAAAATAENKKRYDYPDGSTKSYLDLVDGSHKSNLQASIVFTFFNLVLFIVSAFFSYRENAAEERKR